MLRAGMAEADRRCWVAVEGQLDGEIGEELHEFLLALMGRGCQRVVIDLRQTTFIGSSGLSMLVAALENIAKLGGELVLQAPPPQVYAQGRVRRLGELLAIVGEAIDEVEAISRLSRLFPQEDLAGPELNFQTSSLDQARLSEAADGTPPAAGRSGQGDSATSLRNPARLEALPSLRRCDLGGEGIIVRQGRLVGRRLGALHERVSLCERRRG